MGRTPRTNKLNTEERELMKELEAKLVTVISHELDDDESITESNKIAVALTTLGMLVVKLAASTGVDKDTLLEVLDHTWDLLEHQDDEDLIDAQMAQWDVDTVVH